MTEDRRDQVAKARWGFVHNAIETASRLACAQVVSEEEAESANAFPRAAVAHHAGVDVLLREALTNNNGGFRSGTFRRTYAGFGILRRFIQPALRERAHGIP